MKDVQSLVTEEIEMLKVALCLVRHRNMHAYRENQQNLEMGSLCRRRFDKEL
jgi:hypothetical protein